MKKTVISILLLALLQGSSFEKNCVKCHESLPVELDKFFMRYVLIYSSERRIKEALLSYLQHPTEEKSVMSEAFIRRFGVKPALALPPKELNEAIELFYQTYDIKKRLH